MSLAGRGVLVTRPRELAAALAALIERAGGRAIVFPAIEIEALPQPEPIRRLRDFDLAVFVSPIAVKQAFRCIEGAWPAGLVPFGIGAGTQAELGKHGVPGATVSASGADSEALLALPELDRVHGKRVLIVRGKGGRALLGDTLAARGARVEYAECYRRRRPQADPRPLLAAWARGELHAVTVNSGETLDNLIAMLGAAGMPVLQETPLFVPHARIAARGARAGVREVLVAGASDGEMLERLVAYFSHERKPARR